MISQKMHKVKLSSMSAWSKLGQDIYSPSGQLLIMKGTDLDPSIIKKLLALGLDEVYLVEDEPGPKTASVGEELPIFPTDSYSRLQETIKAGQEAMRRLIAAISAGRSVNSQEIEEAIELLYPEILDSHNVLIQLRILRDKDEYTLQHSVAVSALCIKIGQSLKMPEKAIKKVGLAGMLHDLGKCWVSEEILNKPGPLTDEEIREMSRHPIHGYQILKSNTQVDPEIEIAILQHHERVDGTGYPFQSNAFVIHPYAKIIAVADVFDAMTSDRVYHSKVSPLQAAEEIRRGAYSQLDAAIAYCFLDYLLSLSPGDKVMLNTGEIGEIVLVDKGEPSRPLVRINDQFIDLKTDRKRAILEII